MIIKSEKAKLKRIKRFAEGCKGRFIRLTETRTHCALASQWANTIDDDRSETETLLDELVDQGFLERRPMAGYEEAERVVHEYRWRG